MKRIIWPDFIWDLREHALVIVPTEREISKTGLKGLYDWLEYYESSRPFEAFWDPQREIRSAIEKDLAMISGNRIDWQWLTANSEWLGERMEYEIDQVRRQGSRQQR